MSAVRDRASIAKRVYVSFCYAHELMFKTNVEEYGFSLASPPPHSPMSAVNDALLVTVR